MIRYHTNEQSMYCITIHKQQYAYKRDKKFGLTSSYANDTCSRGRGMKNCLNLSSKIPDRTTMTNDDGSFPVTMESPLQTKDTKENKLV